MEAKIGENKTITIYDIAKEAGVSPATVSRVLTNNAKVNPKKKENILEIIKKYNFKPNALARGLADTKSKTIGIIAADVRNPYYAEVYVACERAAILSGYRVVLCNSFGETKQEENQLEMLDEQRVDAIIQLGGRVDDLITHPEYVEKINSLQHCVPIVVTGKLDGTNCFQVQIDAAKTMEIIMEYLISLNHSKIVLVGGRKTVTSTFIKMESLKHIMKKNGLECNKNNIVEGGYDTQSGYEKMNAIFKTGNIPTAIIAINDFSAAGIMRSIYEHNYKIPEDISIVSFDNTYITELMTPKLTSIDYDYENFGKKLVETAIARIEGKDISKQQFITSTLKVKGSCCEAKGR